jgi:hypothetical protein
MKLPGLLLFTAAFAGLVFVGCNKDDGDNYVEKSSIASQGDSIVVDFSGITDDNIKLSGDRYIAQYYDISLTGKGTFYVASGLTDTIFSFYRQTSAFDDASAIHFSFTKAKKITTWEIHGDYLKDLGSNKVLDYSFENTKTLNDTVTPISNLSFNKTTGALSGKFKFSDEGMKISGHFSVKLVQLMQK